MDQRARRVTRDAIEIASRTEVLIGIGAVVLGILALSGMVCGLAGKDGVAAVSGGPRKHPLEYVGLGLGLVATLRMASYARRVAKQSMESEDSEQSE